MTFSYLASPYQNPDDKGDYAYMTVRYHEACIAAAKLMAQGHVIFCPIAHSHPIADHLPANLRASHDFWLKQDLALLDAADRLLVLMLYQWDRSFGVRKEIERALDRGIPVTYLDPAAI